MQFFLIIGEWKHILGPTLPVTSFMALEISLSILGLKFFIHKIRKFILKTFLVLSPWFSLHKWLSLDLLKVVILMRKKWQNLRTYKHIFIGKHMCIYIYIICGCIPQVRFSPVFSSFCSKYKTAKEKQLKFWSEKILTPSFIIGKCLL